MLAAMSAASRQTPDAHISPGGHAGLQVFPGLRTGPVA